MVIWYLFYDEKNEFKSILKARQLRILQTSRLNVFLFARKICCAQKYESRSKSVY